MTRADPWGNVPRLPNAPGITVAEGDAFMIADSVGDVRPGTGDGYFHRDTRFVSGFRLHVNGRSPDLLTGGTIDPYSARIYLRPAGADTDGSPILIERRRFVGDGVHEDLVVANHGRDPARLNLRVDFEADFADLFEVKRLREPTSRPTIGATVDPSAGVVQLWRRRRRTERSVIIRVMPEAGPELTRKSIVYDIELPARGTWRTCIDILPVRDGVPYEPRCRCDAFGLLENPMAERARAWQASIPTLKTDDDALCVIGVW